MVSWRLVIACLLPALVAAQGSPDTAAVRHAIVVAEDSRAEGAALKPILDGLKDSDPAIQRLAVRALGRLERTEHTPAITPLLSAPDAEVRAEAANALAQVTSADPRAVADLLLKRLAREQHPGVQGALAAAIGRLPYSIPADFGRIEQTLRNLTERHSELPMHVGVAEGFDSLYRRLGRLMRQQTSTEPPRPTEEAVQWLRGVVAIGSNEPFDVRPGPVERTNGTQDRPADGRIAQGRRVRRLALSALISVGAVDTATAKTAAADLDAQVRRLAMVAIGSADPPWSATDRSTLAAAGLKDRDPRVRDEALAAYVRLLPAGTCGPVFRALDDLDEQVAILAIDALGNRCPERERAATELELIIGELSTGRARAEWHRPAHAIVALARTEAARAAKLLPPFVRNPTWQVRMYAARAAGALKAEPVLERLAIDEHDNVRQAAVRALATVSAHQADRLYISALRSRDPQLLIAAAEALAGTPQPGQAVPALLDALQRATAERKDTSRDARVALLARLQALGSKDQAAALRPYLADFDPRVAERAAEALSRWTGARETPVTKRMARAPSPSRDELAALPRRARLTMRGGGIVDLALFGDEAPATVLRFAQLARAGYYNGLTFHRVVPNFVVQGGSPGANEYVGDARYMRDEPGRLTHARGTVGISTRGRDTGDAQIFINLADNPRLDHQYTVFADVTRGMEVVDRILEGDVIGRVDIVQ
ncbi:MAG: peptidylprolyl isomerase [Acidobacteria bacterium]|nr:peptidylprolyl isomerase [Acidobacteriota bacterium]